jgi:flavin-binding protein dodecin
LRCCNSSAEPRPYNEETIRTEEETVAGNTYKLIELVGTSQAGVSEAIESAIAKAAETLRGLDWFEVQQIRGRIENGRISEYQVDIKVGFRVMTSEELQAS